jgi:hypothetical protein
MNCKRTFATRWSTRSFSQVALTLAAATVSVASAQNVTVVSGPESSQTSLAPHLAGVTFVASDANIAQEALQNAAVSAAEHKVLDAVASKALPIPIVGSLPVEGALRLFGKLRKHTVKGFNVAYLPGLTAETVVQSGGASFTISAQTLQGASPLLLRIKPSAKDSARMVRSVHVAVKMTGSNIDPAKMENLGTEQDVIPCGVENRGAAVVLTPSTSLTAGEYAIVLVPAHSNSAETALPAWDFRAVQ